MRYLGVISFLALTGAVSAQFIAYRYPQVSGNQSFGGALGMDFNVNQGIFITALGIFDSAQNGIQNNIDCFIYNRDTQQIVASRFFGPANMGLGDGTTNFLDLPSPIFLPSGFHGSIVAQGFGVLEQNGNSYTTANSFPVSMNTGGGLISFTGTSRYGNFGFFPTNTDLNVAQYGAGNFKFTSASPVPEPATLAILGIGFAALRRRRKA
ncbi:MAG TPA: PEP-CTERM sorting domain-containing protein [Fimbriimonadaceae bacterium]|nr:PEP-CTERM sorting domain-containing protein [Fimbriimonadaceae bacterium]